MRPSTNKSKKGDEQWVEVEDGNGVYLEDVPGATDIAIYPTNLADSDSVFGSEDPKEQPTPKSFKEALMGTPSASASRGPTPMVQDIEQRTQTSTIPRAPQKTQHQQQHRLQQTSVFHRPATYAAIATKGHLNIVSKRLAPATHTKGPRDSRRWVCPGGHYNPRASTKCAACDAERPDILNGLLDTPNGKQPLELLSELKRVVRRDPNHSQDIRATTHTTHIESSGQLVDLRAWGTPPEVARYLYNRQKFIVDVAADEVMHVFSEEHREAYTKDDGELDTGLHQGVHFTVEEDGYLHLPEIIKCLGKEEAAFLNPPWYNSTGPNSQSLSAWCKRLIMALTQKPGTKAWVLLPCFDPNTQPSNLFATDGRYSTQLLFPYAQELFVFEGVDFARYNNSTLTPYRSGAFAGKVIALLVGGSKDYKVEIHKSIIKPQRFGRSDNELSASLLTALDIPDMSMVRQERAVVRLDIPAKLIAEPQEKSIHGILTELLPHAVQTWDSSSVRWSKISDRDTLRIDWTLPACLREQACAAIKGKSQLNGVIASDYNLEETAQRSFVATSTACTAAQIVAHIKSMGISLYLIRDNHAVIFQTDGIDTPEATISLRLHGLGISLKKVWGNEQVRYRTDVEAAKAAVLQARDPRRCLVRSGQGVSAQQIRLAAAAFGNFEHIARVQTADPFRTLHVLYAVDFEDSRSVGLSAGVRLDTEDGFVEFEKGEIEDPRPLHERLKEARLNLGAEIAVRKELIAQKEELAKACQVALSGPPANVAQPCVPAENTTPGRPKTGATKPNGKPTAPAAAPSAGQQTRPVGDDKHSPSRVRGREDLSGDENGGEDEASVPKKCLAVEEQ